MAAILDAVLVTLECQMSTLAKINFRHSPTQSNQETLWTTNAHK